MLAQQLPIHFSFTLFLELRDSSVRDSRLENNGSVSSGNLMPIHCACACTCSSFFCPRTHRRAKALATTAR